VSDPQNPEVGGYVTPTPEELAAQKKRNLAIALSLGGFIILIAGTIMLKISTLQS